MITLVIVYSILFTVLAWQRLEWAIMLILFCLPAYQIRFSVAGIPFTILEVMILISFAVWLWKNTVLKQVLGGRYSWKDYGENRNKRKSYPFGWEAVAWLIVSFAAAGVAGWVSSSLGIWKAYFFEPILFFILVLNVFKPQKKGEFNFDKIVLPLAASAAVLSLAAVYQKITGQFIFNELWSAEATRRATGLFGYPNALGLFLGPLALLFFGWIAANWQKKRDKSIFIAVVLALSLLAIYFARSEGAILAVLATFIIGFFANKRTRIITLVLMLSLGSFVLIKTEFREYAVDKLLLKDLSGEIRQQQWRETWQMLKEGKMITGSGLAGYKKKVEPYHQEGIFFNKDRDPDFDRKIVIFDDKYRTERWQPVEVYLYPHNIFLNFWTELGIIGLALFAWIIIKFYIWWWRIDRKLIKRKQYSIRYFTLGVVGAITVMLIHGLVDVPYFKNDLAVLFWLLIAMFSLIYYYVYEQKRNID